MDAPLKTWYCDICGEKINNVNEGYVIWRSANLKNHDFKIVHHMKCDDPEFLLSAALVDFVGEDGLQRLLAKLSAGHFIQSSFVQVDDLNEYVDFIRRVQTPFYEEARRRFNNQNVIEEMDGANEVFPYLSENLQGIINLPD